MTRPGIEPRSPGPLANTLTAGPIGSFLLVVIFITIMILMILIIITLAIFRIKKYKNIKKLKTKFLILNGNQIKSIKILTKQV